MPGRISQLDAEVYGVPSIIEVHVSGVLLKTDKDLTST